MVSDLSQLGPRFSPARAHAGRTRRRTGIAAWFSFPIILWALLWLSINSGPWNIPDFGAGLSASINAARATFPLVVFVLALVCLTAGRRRRRRSWVETGFWIYGLVMLLACTGAEDWFSQAYWGFAFIAALAVVEKGMGGNDPLEFATRLNWASWLVTVAALVTMLLMARNVLFAPGTTSGYGIVNRFQEAHGYVISRETGLSRMAAVPAIISLVFLFAGSWQQRILSLGVFAASTGVIWVMQSRGALFAFAGAFLFVLLLGHSKAQKVGFFLIVFLAGFAAVGSSSDGMVHDLWQHATRNEGAEGFQGMSGRDRIWQAALDRWSSSPVLGYGPQADRIFPDVNNAQNALLYALLCAGVVGAAFFVISFGASWHALLRLIMRIRRLPRRERTMVQIAGAILVFSTLRSIPENNAALFSVDLLLQYPAMIYLALLHSYAKRSPPGSGLSNGAVSAGGLSNASAAAR
jgi:O-antigen ligase